MVPEISVLDPTNAHVLIPLLRQVHDIHVAHMPALYVADPAEPALERFLRDWLADPMVTAFVAGPPDRPVGYCVIAQERRAGSALRRAETRVVLHHLCVDQAHRRQGIGHGLVSAAQAHARQAGIRRMTVIYARFNRGSAALMERAGLVPEHVSAGAWL